MLIIERKLLLKFAALALTLRVKNVNRRVMKSQSADMLKSSVPAALLDNCAFYAASFPVQRS